MSKKTLTFLTLLTAVLLIGGTVAANTPKFPDSHPKIYPGDDAEKCVECHEVPEEMTVMEEDGNCTKCHTLDDAHASEPDPAHSIDFDANITYCEQCHRAHTGPNPTHQISKDSEKDKLCTTCHVPGNTPDRELTAGEFCGKCHNLGAPEEAHPNITPEGKTTKDCMKCHAPDMINDSDNEEE